MKYRKLINEQVRVGDVASTEGTPEISSLIAEEGDSCLHYLSSEPGWDNDFWYRPIPEDNWIAFSERKPAKEDAANGTDAESLVIGRKGGYLGFHNVTAGFNIHEFTHWMPLNFIPREPTRIKVDGHEVIPNKDGSVKVGCQTVSSQDFEEIARQRNEAMK